MPINSFECEDYFMSWRPDKTKLRRPKYKSLADLLEQDIWEGKLRENTRLPPQRELADFLDVNLSTITKAYKICELKGLIYATVGRGTFVSPNLENPPTLMDKMDKNDAPLIEMGLVLPFYEHNELIRDLALEVLNRPFSERFFEYGKRTAAHQRAACQWLNRFNVETREENVMIAAGSQNALSVALVSLFRSGEGIVTDPYTYPNFIGLANMLDIRLFAAKNDDCGMMPEELDKLCRVHRPKGIYLMPSRNNPTNVGMDDDRRKEIARVIEKHELLLIEDDIYAFLCPRCPAPLASSIPERTIYVSGVSKPICAGVRVAFVSFPGWCRSVLEQGLYNHLVNVPLLNVEIVAEAIRRGVDVALIQKKREAAVQRNRVFFEHFPLLGRDLNRERNEMSYFQWLPLPAGCSGKSFELQAKKRGLKLYGSERFAVGNTNGESAVRVAVCAPQNETELKRGLFIIKELFEEYESVEAPTWIV
jgi:DNA-binding transcriptional MocR family regulator